MPLVEFTVEGPPVSHQTRNRGSLAAWKATVRSAAAAAWRGGAPVKVAVKCTILYFFEGPEPPLDDDNMAKPIRDAMNGLVYLDDRQIHHSDVRQESIDAFFHIRGASAVILNAFQLGLEFV